MLPGSDIHEVFFTNFYKIFPDPTHVIGQFCARDKVSLCAPVNTRRLVFTIPLGSTSGSRAQDEKMFISREASPIFPNLNCVFMYKKAKFPPKFKNFPPHINISRE